MAGSTKLIFGTVLAFFAVVTLSACGDTQKSSESGGHGAAKEEFERGPHRGRLLRSGDFALEMTIFETNVPPMFHIYPYNKGEPISPERVKLSVTLNRLGDRADVFTFTPEKDYLAGSGVVTEPHSFDVVVTAVYDGKSHRWSYANYEGRTIISDKAAADAGVMTEAAGGAAIKTTVQLMGKVDFAPGAKTELRARFPGRVVRVTKNVGDTVAQGEELARVESNESLQTYAIVAPSKGIVLSRAINPGDVTSDGIVFEIGDPSKLMAEFHVFDRDSEVVKVGQEVRIASLDGRVSIDARISAIGPLKDPSTQTVMARALFVNPESQLRPGAQVTGHVAVSEAYAELAVRSEAIQPFRDFEVVYAKVGETYEVRMLEIGRRSAEWTEVLGGLRPGEVYVSKNSFLIRADIEKSGASHDH
jgi:membrane fusion protein, heavy metal efflux system